MNTTELSRNNGTQIDAWTFDVGAAGDSVEAYAESCIHRVEQSWAAGADIVLFPEYTWAGLEPLLPTGAGMPGVAQVVWQQLIPEMVQRLAKPGKTAVLGTAPYYNEDTGELHNRAVIISSGKLLWQDKLYLTPWESAFSPGHTLEVFQMNGLRVAVLICLDIEVPELSALLRGQNIDLILVPSATETLLGCERITRCASARAVELGCAVVVSALVGRCSSTLVDENLGKLALYLPSQAAFINSERLAISELHQLGFHLMTTRIDGEKLRSARQRQSETNPVQLVKNAVICKSQLA